MACAFLPALCAAAAQASFTPIQPGSPSHTAILDSLYGGTFVPAGANLPDGMNTAYSNGSTVVTRMDDDGKASLLYILISTPGTADDDVWGDGAATINARARYSESAQEFGYNQGAGYVKMFEVSAGGYAAAGMATVIFNNNAVWQWARADDSANGPVNLHQSDEPSNPGGLDHMVTYLVTGAPGVPDTVRVWLLFFERDADRDFNDLVIQLQVIGCTVNSQCDDGIACTFDLCGPKRFCINAPLHSRCQDSDICTTDVCDPLLGCVNAPLDCGDGNACTLDVCDPVAGCTHALDDCDDGIECTIDECDPVDGCANVPDHALCDDHNDCTIDLCHPQGGCTNTPAPWGAACGNQTPQGPCDRPDVCDGLGQCVPYFHDSSTVCRAPVAICDVAEFCTGTSPNCPPDAFQPSTLQCRAAAGVCDVTEFCTGSSANCPPDAFQPSTLSCRASAGDCDVTEFCTGATANCPPDALLPGTTVCREAAGECDETEFCSGSDVACPPDGFMPSDTPCGDDGDECTLDLCDGKGHCAHPENSDCRACCLPTGACENRVLPQTCEAAGGASAGADDLCMGDMDGDGVDELCDLCPGVDDAVFGVLTCRGSGAPCASDADCGPGGMCRPACEGTIPTVSQWGLVVLALLLLVGGKLFFQRRPMPVRA